MHATAWMNLKSLRLRDITRHKSSRVVGFHLCEMCRIGQVTEAERLVLSGVGERGVGRSLPDGYGVSANKC